VTQSTETLLNFVNTRADAGGRVEQFGTGAALAEWAAEHDLLDGDTVVTDADAAAARELRDALVSVMLAHSGTPEADEDTVAQAERYLGQAGSRYPLTTVVTAGGVRVGSESRGVPGVLGGVLAAITDLGLSGAWDRVKACANPPCHLGFVDRTRNRAGRFCSSTCGSQASVRAHRARQRQTAGDTPQ
jgi:predicted RNA-binding Zn ribbon-like protein